DAGTVVDAAALVPAPDAMPDAAPPSPPDASPPDSPPPPPDAALPPAVLAMPAAQDFGEVTIGESSSPVTLSVTNTGGLPSGVLAASLAAGTGFTIAANGCPSSLAAGGSCTIGVRFEPGSVGPKQGVSLTVSSTPGGSAAASLRGTGTAVLSLSPSTGGRVTSA